MNPLDVLKGIGPRGGDLDNPDIFPVRRRMPLQTEPLPDGNLGLHRFSKEDTATFGIKNEQPWHRMAAYMLNAGRTNSEIALAASVDPTTVSHLRSQRWFQELCATIANTEGEEILGLIRSETAASIETIVEIRDNPDAGARARLSAAQVLLEHAHGKPIQKIVSNISHSRYTSPKDEMRAIEEELAAMRSPSSSSEIPEAEASVK